MKTIKCFLSKIYHRIYPFRDRNNPPRPNAMKLGIELIAPTPNPEKYMNDLIHPCVRHVEGGFAEHNWWMVATPYYKRDSSVENPILYYGDSPGGGLPPLEWTATAIVEDTPENGYNSDPCLFYDGIKLWVFWRKNFTKSCEENNMKRGTFGVSTTDGFSFSPKKFYAGAELSSIDAEMSPVVINIAGKTQLYGCYYEFEPIRQPKGLAIWDIENNDLENNPFTLTTLNEDLHYYTGFNFWHFDLFSHKNKLYCVVSPENGDEILLGVSSDGINFRFWPTPLISSRISGATYLYKPTAMVLNDIFYLWYPKCMDDGINKIHMSEINFDELVHKLNQMEK